MSQSSKYKIAVSAVAPIVLLTVLIVFILGSGSSFLQFGTVLPEFQNQQNQFFLDIFLVKLFQTVESLVLILQEIQLVLLREQLVQ